MSRIAKIGLLLILLIFTGVLGFKTIEYDKPEATWLNCVYFTILTLTTVGYGETIPLSDAGKVFVSAYLLVGFGAFTYSAFTIGQWLLSTELESLLERRRMTQAISHLRGHFIVCGLGRMGRTICQQLHERGRAFVVIDTNEVMLHEECAPDGWPYIVGDATDDHILKQAGIDHAQALAAVLPTDAANIYVVLSARLLKKDLQIIARASEDKASVKLIQAGANRVVSPYSTGATKMARFMLNPNIEDFLEIADNKGRDLELADVLITASSPYIGKKLMETNLRDLGVMVIGIRRANGERLMPPPGTATIEVGDCLFAFGSADAVNQLIGVGQKTSSR